MCWTCGNYRQNLLKIEYVLGLSCATDECGKTTTVQDAELEQASSFQSKKARPKFSFKSRADIGKTRILGRSGLDRESNLDIRNISNPTRVAHGTLSSESLVRTNQEDGQSSSSQLSVGSSKGQSSNSQLSVASCTGQSSSSQLSVASSTELQEPEFIFPAGMFDIVLYVDNHEYFRWAGSLDALYLSRI